MRHLQLLGCCARSKNSRWLQQHLYRSRNKVETQELPWMCSSPSSSLLQYSSTIHYAHQQQQQRCFSSHSNNNNNTQSTTTATWQRSAIKVKNTELYKDNPYLDAIRQTHDPSQHIKTIEDELKQTIGQALGKQGRKIQWAVTEMVKEYDTFVQLAEQLDTAVAAARVAKETGTTTHRNPNQNPALLTKAERKRLKKQIRKSCFRHNRWRNTALTARWEMTVQRQAAGMVVNNREHVIRSYPIPDAILLQDDRQKLRKSTRERLPPCDHWWQRINYWNYLKRDEGPAAIHVDPDDDDDDDDDDSGDDSYNNNNNSRSRRY